jgi:hypothetical protein
VKELTIQTGRDETKTASELQQIPDLWHLAQVMPKISGAITETVAAREEWMLEDAGGERLEAAVIALAEFRFNGEQARDAVLDVWHLAKSQARALHRIEREVNDALRALDSHPAQSLNRRPALRRAHDKVRKILTESLEGGAD